jgi:3-deoxy-manno-octulosonate cytidylyltransferase (CMP-KDO synthetase)
MTDNKHIADQAVGWGAEVFETGDYGIRNGTERCALFAAFNQLRWGDTVINLQGDALLTPPEWIRHIAGALRHGDESETGETVATIAAPWGHSGLGSVVCYSDIMGHAYHFSRAREGVVIHPEALVHFGIYAYTVEALLEYKAFDGHAPLEANEDLEQLRWAHLARPVKVLGPPDDAGRVPLCEVNYPSDVPLVQEELKKWGIE